MTTHYSNFYREKKEEFIKKYKIIASKKEVKRFKEFLKKIHSNKEWFFIYSQNAVKYILTQRSLKNIDTSLINTSLKYINIYDKTFTKEEREYAKQIHKENFKKFFKSFAEFELVLLTYYIEVLEGFGYYLGLKPLLFNMLPILKAINFKPTALKTIPEWIIRTKEFHSLDKEAFNEKEEEEPQNEVDDFEDFLRKLQGGE